MSFQICSKFEYDRTSCTLEPILGFLTLLFMTLKIKIKIVKNVSNRTDCHGTDLIVDCHQQIHAEFLRTPGTLIDSFSAMYCMQVPQYSRCGLILFMTIFAHNLIQTRAQMLTSFILAKEFTTNDAFFNGFNGLTLATLMLYVNVCFEFTWFLKAFVASSTLICCRGK